MWCQCSRCKKYKPLWSFGTEKKDQLSVFAYCKSCHKEYDLERNSKVREEKSKRAMEWFFNNRERNYKKNAKRTALKREHYSELTLEEQKIIKSYSWLKKQLKLATGETWSIDHIVPLSKGGNHHPDNIQLIPLAENRSKYNDPLYKPIKIVRIEEVLDYNPIKQGDLK